MPLRLRDWYNRGETRNSFRINYTLPFWLFLIGTVKVQFKDFQEKCTREIQFNIHSDCYFFQTL